MAFEAILRRDVLGGHAGHYFHAPESPPPGPDAWSPEPRSPVHRVDMHFDRHYPGHLHHRLSRAGRRCFLSKALLRPNPPCPVFPTAAKGPPPIVTFTPPQLLPP